MRDDDGNLFYLAHRSRADAGRFTLFEAWRDQAALEAHAAAPVAGAFFMRPEIVGGAPPRVYQLASTADPRLSSIESDYADRLTVMATAHVKTGEDVNPRAP